VVRSGIHALQQASGQFGPIPGKFGNDNIAEQTIQSFYNAIPDDSKFEAKASTTRRTTQFSGCTLTLTRSFATTRYLIFDITLQAFYPWEVTEICLPMDLRIGGAINDRGFVSTQVAYRRYYNSGGCRYYNSAVLLLTTSMFVTSVEYRPTNLTYVTCMGPKYNVLQVLRLHLCRLEDV
jgi:hypothetical protein